MFMGLPETFEIVQPSIVALGSKHGLVIDGKPPTFPTILGTGFFIDQRGIVLTNGHVVEALQQLPKHPKTGESLAVAFVFSDVRAEKGSHAMRVSPVDIKAYNTLKTFDAKERFYGEEIPDLALVQLNVKDVPALTFASERNTLRIGMPIATAGFPLGTDALLLNNELVQLTPLLRSGIISSLYPFPCPNPHGFTLDIMEQGGASGSPIFLPSEPKVVGLLYAGYPGVNITVALSSFVLDQAMSQTREHTNALDLSEIPTLKSLAEMDGSDKPTWETV